MLIKLEKLINKNQINQFIVISFFFIFLTFVLSKGFISNEETSDKIFLIISVVLIEVIYLLTANNFIRLNILTLRDNFLLLFVFIFNFLIWNSETIISYTNVILFILFHIILAYGINIFFTKKLIVKNEKSEIDNLLLIIIISFFLSGLFYDLNYESFKEYLIIVILLFLTISVIKLINKSHKYFDIIISSFIFIIFFKVFILSSEKDLFHYSWFLGPINSLSENYSLLENVVSQYGFLNILLVNKITQIVNFDSSYVLVTIISIFFLIFFYFFFINISKIINLPNAILITFLALVIFGKSSYANLSGAMFIPSSSVFRFLPSLIFILFFSKFINNDTGINQKILVYFLLTINLFWSFESAFFVCLPISIFFLTITILNFKKIQLKKKLSNLLHYKYFILLSLLIIIFLFLKDKNFFLFYEHALNSNSSLPEKIENNRVTLSYVFILFLSYIILRDSFINKSYFYYNILWFSLFVAYSLYFLIRSVDNNFFNLLPFLIFIICVMKTHSKYIYSLRKKTIIIVIFFSIIYSLNIIYKNNIKFFDVLVSKNIIVAPEYLKENYKPNIKIQNKINEFKNIPVTLISGKFIHKPNINLSNKGYGLPIIPLEQFNILNIKVKQKLINNFFKINNSHLVLCINKCEFYYSESENNYYNKIFIGKNVHSELLINHKNLEFLYLLTTNN